MISFENVSKAYPTPNGIQTVLQDMTFTIKKNCKLGILGLNGSGKSTLINLIAGAQMASGGRILREGRVSWPLGFGGGFNGSLSGLENCLFIARIYGRDEKQVVDFVEDFSELGPNFRQQVKSYSSGMRARLAFGLSLAFDFDYYLIDEVIAVGDAPFKLKCKTALNKVQEKAGIILVSHSIRTIREYCTDIAVVHDRRVQFFDDAMEGYQFYGVLTKNADAIMEAVGATGAAHAAA